MDNRWRFIDSGPCAAAHNMALDEAIAYAVRRGDSPPTLRFYGWLRPSVSIGAFQKISDVDTDYCACHDIEIVRRPTGGRGVLHSKDLTYSFSARNELFFSRGLLDTYRKISSAFSLALEKLGLPIRMDTRRERERHITRSPLCFQSTSYGELIISGKKLIGSAQKRWSDGFLQQGSIPYETDNALLATVFQTLPANFSGLKDIVHDLDAEDFKKRIRESFEILFGISLLESLPSDREAEQAHQLCSEKYLQPLLTRGAATRDDQPYNNEICRPA